MLVYPEDSGNALPGELVIKTVLRSDLTPVPQTVEIEVRDSIETRAMRMGSLVKVGRESLDFKIIKNGASGDTGLTAGDKAVKTRSIVGLLSSCEPVAKRTQRSIVRFGAPLGEIYRACGAQVRIDSDFSVQSFSCFKGMTPTYEIAKALQEEAGALVLVNGRIAFRRLAEMTKGDPVATLREDSTQSVESEFLEQHQVPFAFSTGPSGAFLTGRAEGGHGVMYRPRATEAILNNLGTALILRRKVPSDFAPHILAGMRFDVAGKPLVVITAAHRFEGGADGDGGQQDSMLWLGEVVR